MSDEPARSDEPPIRDNPSEGRWEIAVGGETAWLAYSRGPAVLGLLHTEIPESLGGRGLASRLARHAMQVASDAGLSVDPYCPFMIGWLDRHTEYAALVRKPRSPAVDDPFWL